MGPSAKLQPRPFSQVNTAPSIEDSVILQIINFRFPWRSRPECVYMLVDMGKDPIGSLLCLSVLHGLYLLPTLESSLRDNHRIFGTRRPLERSGAPPLALLPQ